MSEPTQEGGHEKARYRKGSRANFSMVPHPLLDDLKAVREGDHPDHEDGTITLPSGDEARPTGNTIAVYVALNRFADFGSIKGAAVSDSRVAREAAQSVRSVAKHRAILQKLGWLEWDSGQGRGGVNQYYVHELPPDQREGPGGVENRETPEGGEGGSAIDADPRETPDASGQKEGSENNAEGTLGQPSADSAGGSASTADPGSANSADNREPSKTENQTTEKETAGGGSPGSPPPSEKPSDLSRAGQGGEEVDPHPYDNAKGRLAWIDDPDYDHLVGLIRQRLHNGPERVTLSNGRTVDMGVECSVLDQLLRVGVRPVEIQRFILGLWWMREAGELDWLVGEGEPLSLLAARINPDNQPSLWSRATNRYRQLSPREAEQADGSRTEQVEEIVDEALGR